MNKIKNKIDYETDWLLDEVGGRGHIIDVLSFIRDMHGIQNKRIVELGSGIGTNLQIFLGANDVVGIEGMEDAVNESIRMGVPAICADLELPLPLASSSADLVLCIDVLEHLMRPEICIDEAHRLLAPNGQLVINVPNHFDWRGRLSVLFGSGIDSQGYFPNSMHWNYPHIRFFSRESIEKLIKKSGFYLEEDYCQSYLSFPKEHMWKRLGLRSLMLKMQKMNPNLFTSGFMLRFRKI